jgi:uncharacterized protein (DUF58 family)
MISQKLKSLRQKYGSWITASPIPVSEPLLNSSELSNIDVRATSDHRLLISFDQPSAHRLIGDTLSFYRGRGFEFEENRAYQAGDEPRLINWRLYARTGVLHSKVFNEERRPEVFLVVDRRAAMRFGTRKQLKAAQAVKIAAYYFYYAQRHALPTGGVVLDESIRWFSPGSGGAPHQDLLQALASPCPPLAFDSPQPGMDEAMAMLLTRAPAGSYILVVSDFRDLHSDTSTPLFQELSQSHHVDAVMIRDHGEDTIDNVGNLLIDDPSTEDPIRVDGHEQNQRTRFEQAATRRRKEIISIMRQSNVNYRQCKTDDDFTDCLNAEYGNR